LIGTPELCMKCGARPRAGNGYCTACGSETNQLAVICVKCGARLNGLATPWKPVIAGLLSMVAGLFNIVTGGSIVYWAYSDGSIGWAGILHVIAFGAVVWVFGIVTILLGATSVAGGILALRRRAWMLTLVGSISAVLVGWFWVVPAILGIVAIVFAMLAKRDFGGQRRLV
jgi:hypothetical protein